MRYRVVGVAIVHQWGTDKNIDVGTTYTNARDAQRAQDNVLETVRKRASAESARWGWCEVKEA